MNERYLQMQMTIADHLHPDVDAMKHNSGLRDRWWDIFGQVEEWPVREVIREYRRLTKE